MKILFITGEYPPQISGIGDYVFHLASQLSKTGFEIVVLTSFSDQPPLDRDSPVKVLRQISKWDKTSWEIIQKIVLEENPDIVHLQYHTYSFQRDSFINILPIKMKSRFPKVIFFTTYHEFAAPYKRLALLPLLFGSTMNIVTNDRDFGKLLRLAPLGFIKKRVRYIPLGSGIPYSEKSEEQISKIRTNLGLKDSTCLLIRFGFLHSAAVSEMLPLLPILAALQTEGIAFKFLWIGKQDPDARNSLNEGIHARGLREVISFYNACPPEEVSMLLQAADVGIAPYQDGISERRSGFLALLTHGVPTLTTKGENPPASLVHYENVLLLSRHNEEAWTTALRDLILNPALRKKISQNAKESSKIYHWEAIAKAHSSSYLYEHSLK